MRRLEFDAEMRERECLRCPLSFCRSYSHTNIIDCDHPNKHAFAGPFHNVVCRACRERSSSFGLSGLRDFILELKNTYFTEYHLPEEQIDILLFRFHATGLEEASRTQKTNRLLREYAKMTKYYYYGPDYDDNVWGGEQDGNIDRDIDEMLLEEEEREGEEEETIPMEQTPEHPPEETPTTHIQLVLEENPNPLLYKTKNGYLTDLENNLLECPICYETECFVMTPCSHVFCECIVQHVMNKTLFRIGADCPCCREPIMALKISHPKHYRVMSYAYVPPPVVPNSAVPYQAVPYQVALSVVPYRTPTFSWDESGNVIYYN